MRLVRSLTYVLAATALSGAVAVAGPPSASAASAPHRPAATVGAVHAGHVAAVPAVSSSVAARASRVVLLATPRISRGERARVTVLPGPGHVGKRLQVQAFLSGRWTTLADSRITSTAAKQYTLRTKTSVRLRAVVLTTGGRVVAVSRVSTVSVGR